ncbi:MAG TPA: PDZ domain-containing protein [Candidatus Bathyarchaeota archaeon]|nr:PDZ domain-containing protein [Candidatus Bathyarchaeota archaeon]
MGYSVSSLTDQNPEAEKTEPGRIEFNFPLLTVRTKIFSGVFDKLGSLRASRLTSWVALAIVPVVAAIGMYMLCRSLFELLWNPAAGEAVSQLGPAAYLLLPGINPFLPIVYGWLAIVCAIVVHEGAHGIIARNRGLKVKSSGLLFFLVIPIGAFVDVDEEQLEKAKHRDSLRVMAAGVAGNIVVALVCLLAVLLIVNGLTPVVNGVYVSEVTEGMPAQEAGLLPSDVFVSIDNVPIASLEELAAVLENKSAGDLVHVTVARGTDWEERFSTSVTLTESTEEDKEGKAVMGVLVGDLVTEERLTFYRTLTPEKLFLYMFPPSLYPGLVPFSDFLVPFYTSVLGAQWHVYANTFFWLWFVNFNVALFNALPIYPLDGGRMFNITLKSVFGRRVSEKTITRITAFVTVAIIWLFVMIILIPFIL